MKTEKVKFKFKGKRDYIHGTDIFNFMLSSEPEKKNQIRFTVHEFVHSPFCKIYQTDNKDDLSEVVNIVARCQFEINGHKQFLALVQEQGLGQEQYERYGYNESEVTDFCRISDNTIVILKKSPFTFIETIVAMNKHLHEKLFPDVVGKWVFTRIDLDSVSDVRSNIELQFQHNMNYRLTKSDVIVNKLKIGDIYFSLVKS